MELTRDSRDKNIDSDHMNQNKLFDINLHCVVLGYLQYNGQTIRKSVVSV